MNCDLRWLNLHGLVERRVGNNSCTPTPDGIRVAVFDTKLRTRLLRPRLEASKPPLSSSFLAPWPSRARARLLLHERSSLRRWVKPVTRSGG